MKKKKIANLTSAHKHIRKHVMLALVPHKANQYRPHAIRRYGIALILLFIFCVQATYNGATTGSVLGVETQVTLQELLNSTNRARVDEGLSTLKASTKLEKAAQLKAQDILKNQYWAHTSPSGTTPWYWFEQVGYSYADAGENLAKNFSTADGVLSAWLQSPSHRANVLKTTYQDVGFAIVSGTLDGRKISVVVALYGAPAELAVQGTTTSVSATGQQLSLIGKLGVGLQSLTPAAVGSLVILLIAANIALITHFYRQKLPPAFRRGWSRHHGLYKAIGFVSLAVVLLFAYGSTGQI